MSYLFIYPVVLSTHIVVLFLLLAEAIQEDLEEEFCSNSNKDSQQEEMTARMPPATATKPPPALKSIPLPVKRQLKSPPPAAVKEKEVPWLPVFSKHTHPANGHDRFMFVIGLPGSFSGVKGSYKVGIDKNGTKLLFSVPVNKVFTDPHQVHSLLTEK